MKSPSRLLEFDLRAGGFELLLDLLGFGLGDVFLDGLRSAFDEVLGFLEAQASDGADFLDDADLVRAGFLEDDGELGLRFSSGSSGGSASGGSGGDGSGGGNAPLAFEIFDEGGEVENRLAGQPLDDLVFGDVAHDDLLEATSGFESETRLRDVSPSLLSLDLDFRRARRRRRRSGHEKGLGCGLFLLLNLGVEDADESRGVLVEQAEQLRAEGLEARQVGDLGEICGGDDLLVQHADLDLELLLVLEELLQDLRDAGGILSADDNGRRAGQRAFEIGQAQGLGRDAERAVLDDVELGLLRGELLRSSATSATVTFVKFARMT